MNQITANFARHSEHLAEQLRSQLGPFDVLLQIEKSPSMVEKIKRIQDHTRALVVLYQEMAAHYQEQADKG